MKATMAGGVERVLRRRIRSIQSTKKITRAMELIAASRIVRAQQRVLAARPYIEQMTQVIRHLSKAGAGLNQPLLVARDEVRHGRFVVHHRRPGPGRRLQRQRRAGDRAGDRPGAGRRA